MSLLLKAVWSDLNTHGQYFTVYLAVNIKGSVWFWMTEF